MGYNDTTLKKLFSLSGNVCAFPNCIAPIFDTDLGIVVGEICHIKGKSPNGPRYDSNQTDEERNSYENLMLMCGAHNKIIDDKKTRDRFPVELLMQYKADHEAKYQNSVVNDELTNRFVSELNVEGSIIRTFNQTGGQAAHLITNYINQPTPPPPQINLTLLFEWLLTKVEHEIGEDYYDFRITIRNDGSTTVRDFRLDIDFPNEYLNQHTICAAEVESRRTLERRLFRMTPDKFGGILLYPGDSRHVFSGTYIIRKRQYAEGMSERIVVSLYHGDELLDRVEKPIAEMLNEERMLHLGIKKSTI